ncbi:hypothetical protein A4X06_0g3182 [Tilletia controversa]|uniref:Uncharacterized protein n=1 Tax=Tilletia controversa TaxID=13291 RepID=A0A8X7SXQ0_9BASI|nr:hypothetical protein A4X06_0g3182 [Tilletia controversa]
MTNIHLFFVLSHLLLLLATLGQSLPLPDPNCPSCLGLAQPYHLEVRAGPPGRPDSDILLHLFMNHHADWQRLNAEMRRLQLTHLVNLPPDVEEQIRRLLAQSEGSREGALRVLDELERVRNIPGGRVNPPLPP